MFERLDEALVGKARELPPATRRERERERTGYEPFAFHAPIHWAMLGVCDQDERRLNRLASGGNQQRGAGKAFQGVRASR